MHAAGVVVDLGDNPLLAFALGLFTPEGAGWLIGAVVTGRWLLQQGRWKTLLKRFTYGVRTTTTIAKLEPTLAAIRADLGGLRTDVTEHLHEAELIKANLGSSIHEVNSRLDVLVALGRDVHHEVKNNGGSSMKDSTYRIERALGLPEPTEAGERLPTGPVVMPTP